MGYDIAFGASQAQLNTISAGIYQAAPDLFNGSQNVPKFDVTVTWTVTSPPAIDLSGAPGGGAASTFTLTIPMQLVIAEKTTYDPTLTATVAMTSSGSTLGLNITSLTATSVQDPIGDYVIQNVVIPAVQSAANTLLASITIPPLKIPGLAFGPLAIGISGGYLVGSFYLGATATPAAPAGGWPAQPFLALVSPAAVQALVAYGVEQVGDTKKSARHIKVGTGYYWSYRLGIGGPKSQIGGGGAISVQLALTGEVSGGGEIVYVKVGVDFKAYAKPDPKAHFKVKVKGSEIVITFDHVDTFEVAVAPSGSWSEEIISVIVDPIVQAVVAVATPAVTALVKNIHVASVSIPTVSVPISKSTLVFSITGATLSTSDTGLQVTGQLAVT